MIVFRPRPPSPTPMEVLEPMATEINLNTLLIKSFIKIVSLGINMMIIRIQKATLKPRSNGFEGINQFYD